eukprot:2032666-Lingulodinium_polyedra.AAC.1
MADVHKDEGHGSAGALGPMDQLAHRVAREVSAPVLNAAAHGVGGKMAKPFLQEAGARALGQLGRVRPKQDRPPGVKVLRLTALLGEADQYASLEGQRCLDLEGGL